MAFDGPRFRRDLVSTILQEDGVRCVDVRDPKRRTSFRLFDYEYSVALAFDGRPLAKVIPWVRVSTGLDLTAEQLTAFAERLAQLGFLASDEDRTPGVALEMTPAPPMRPAAEAPQTPLPVPSQPVTCAQRQCRLLASPVTGRGRPYRYRRSSRRSRLAFQFPKHPRRVRATCRRHPLCRRRSLPGRNRARRRRSQFLPRQKRRRPRRRRRRLPAEPSAAVVSASPDCSPQAEPMLPAEEATPAPVEASPAANPPSPAPVPPETRPVEMPDKAPERLPSLAKTPPPLPEPRPAEPHVRRRGYR